MLGRPLFKVTLLKRLIALNRHFKCFKKVGQLDPIRGSGGMVSWVTPEENIPFFFRDIPLNFLIKDMYLSSVFQYKEMDRYTQKRKDQFERSSMISSSVLSFPYSFAWLKGSLAVLRYRKRKRGRLNSQPTIKLMMAAMCNLSITSLLSSHLGSVTHLSLLERTRAMKEVWRRSR